MSPLIVKAPSSVAVRLVEPAVMYKAVGFDAGNAEHCAGKPVQSGLLFSTVIGVFGGAGLGAGGVG